MSWQAIAQLRYPARVPWWRWVELSGATGIIVLFVLFCIGYVPHPVAIAALLHLAADFTFQSPETASQKAESSRHLLVHALVAGGLPLALAAAVTGDPIAVLVWTLLGAVSHYAVDWTRKFGLRRLVWAVLLDQACHVVTIVIVALVCSPWL
jgi:hypothetical protein